MPPEFVGEIKKRVFIFDDIVKLDDATVAKALQSLEEPKHPELGLALRVAGDEVRDKIFKHMSEPDVLVLKEDMELMGPIRMMNADDASIRICAVFLALEEKGEIAIRG